MLSRLALLGVLLCGLLSVAWATTPINTPANQADVSAQHLAMCLLSDLRLDGLSLVQTGRADGLQKSGFEQNHFTYSCSCDANFAGTKVYPFMVDGGSSAEVMFNGVKVNYRSVKVDGQWTGISNDGKATTDGVALSPVLSSTGSFFLKFRTGLNTILVGVGCNGQADPNCYFQYKIECTKPPGSGSSVSGDPQFVGLRGQSYQVHGVDGEIYNIVSDADLQYNSRFVFLSSGECPRIHGRKAKNCWSHPGSYLGELGLKTRAGDKIRVLPGAASEGFQTVEVNGRALEMGESVMLAEDLGSVSRNSTHIASVQVGNWDFVFENSDGFVNQKVRAFDARKLRSHGLLGQTWREATYPNAVKHIQGAVDDYVIHDQDIFGDNFVFNAFN